MLNRRCTPIKWISLTGALRNHHQWQSAVQATQQAGLMQKEWILSYQAFASGLKTVRGEPVEPRFLPMNALRQAHRANGWSESPDYVACDQ
jgi:hypothetical protein